MVIDLPPSSSGGTTLITKVIWDRADSSRVITGTSDGKVRAWDLRSRQETHSAEVQGEEGEGGREGGKRRGRRLAAGCRHLMLCIMFSTMTFLILPLFSCHSHQRNRDRDGPGTLP